MFSIYRSYKNLAKVLLVHWESKEDSIFSWHAFFELYNINKLLIFKLLKIDVRNRIDGSCIMEPVFL